MSTRSTRITRIIIKQQTLVFFVLFVFLVHPVSASAWGSITHVAVCRAAGGNEEAQTGAHAPDMIALYSVTSGDHEFDYAHNNFSGGDASAFGDLMLARSGDGFAAGWRIHQISDSVVHGSAGYSNTKTFFSGLPAKYKTSLNHGAVELIIDAIILRDRFDGGVSLWLPDCARLIHETAVAFYNEGLPGGGRIPRSSIVSCRASEKMGGAWESWLITNAYLAELITQEPWFPAAIQYLSDFRPLFDKSVSLSATSANLPQTEQLNKRSTPAAWLLNKLLPATPVLAATDEEATSPDNGGYARFVALVSEKAKQLGNGKITKESVVLALDQLAGERGLTAEEELWAKTLKEMATGHKQDLAELRQAVADYGRSSDDGKEAASTKGAAGGRRGGFLPCLPGAILAAAALFCLVRLVR